ncbi:MAG TPA: 2'-5' RNA ligase family protein [Candidatus Paceibacterota bacterium]|jgi:2'-5' RNA ligase|nr:2'-5' RNA ligase family protein [Candidatus Paceibacterota bacterium]
MIDPHSDKTEGYHLFIEPPAPLGEKLQWTIAALAQAYGGPAFAPHVTLLARISEEPEEELLRKAQLLAQSLVPFSVSLDEEGMEDAYFRALYLHAGGAGIRDAHAKTNGAFGLEDDAPYVPHLSLLYGNYPLERKEAALAALPVRAGTEFRADRLSVWRTPGEVRAWKKIAELPFGTDGLA